MLHKIFRKHFLVLPVHGNANRQALILMLKQIIRQLEDMIGETAALQSPYVQSACPRCKAPCCERVGYLFSEKDILFLKLSGRSSPRRRGRKRGKGCVHLLPSGCRLEPGSRPLACHRYLCPDLKMEMNGHEADLVERLEEGFRKMDELQARLWSEYLIHIRASAPFPSGKQVRKTDLQFLQAGPGGSQKRPNESLDWEIP